MQVKLTGSQTSTEVLHQVSRNPESQSAFRIGAAEDGRMGRKPSLWFWFQRLSADMFTGSLFSTVGLCLQVATLHRHRPAAVSRSSGAEASSERRRAARRRHSGLSGEVLVPVGRPHPPPVTVATFSCNQFVPKVSCGDNFLFSANVRWWSRRTSDSVASLSATETRTV